MSQRNRVIARLDRNNYGEGWSTLLYVNQLDCFRIISSAFWLKQGVVVPCPRHGGGCFVLTPLGKDLQAMAVLLHAAGRLPEEELPF